MRKRIAGVVSVAVLSAGLVISGALLSAPSDAGRARRAATLARSAVGGTPTDISITSLQRPIVGDLNLAADHATRALAYLEKARSEADPHLYTVAERALAASLDEQPRGNFAATLGMAILAGSRHDFRAQLEWGRRAVTINPYNAEARGVVGDAHLELGHTQRALDAYQQMVDLRPALSSFGRISFAAQLLGDTEGAIAAARRALDFAAESSDVAWAHWNLAELHIGAQRLGRADSHLDDALTVAPGFPPALEASAHVAAARGDRRRAIGILSSLVDVVPLPAHLSFLGELHLLEGEGAHARAAFAAADRQLERYGRHGVLPDVDFITFWVDRGIHERRALRAARTLYAQRKSAAVSDALAWALYGSGRAREALHYAREALRRSSGDAGYHYHAGMIARTLGREQLGRSLLRRALALDRSWSIIEAQRARHILGDRDRGRHASSTDARGTKPTRERTDGEDAR